MKRLFIPCLAGAVLSCAQLPTNAQEFKEHISKEFTLTKDAASNVVSIYNISGFIKVEGYAGNKVIMEIDKTISAKNNETLNIGKEEFKLEFEQKGDSIIAYISEPYDSRPNRNWNRGNDQRRINYKYNLAFTLKVPYNINLKVSTINDGNITVKDVAGAISAHNINGGITLTNAKGKTDVHTINGDVEINYLVNPPGKSSYYTLNGDIRVSYPANWSADLEFKSFNGDFYTDFTDTKILPARVTKTQEQKGSGTVYKLNKDTGVRIGSGGETFKFETFNGNVYIKKQS